jgi:hypothetical protein
LCFFKTLFKKFKKKKKKKKKKMAVGRVGDNRHFSKEPFNKAYYRKLTYVGIAFLLYAIDLGLFSKTN